MKKILIVILILSFNPLFANDNLNKLNNLFLNGILDKESYFSSINNLGIDTDNETFINLFKLFSNKVLDIKSYEKSLNNLIDILDNNDKEIIVLKDNTQLKKSKSYIASDCKGDSTLCSDIVMNSIFNFYFENDEVLLNTKWLDDIVSSDPAIIRYMGLKFNRNSKSDDFKVMVDLFHIKGILIKISFRGFFENDDFFVNRMIVNVRTQEVVNADLVEKLNQ